MSGAISHVFSRLRIDRACARARASSSGSRVALRCRAVAPGMPRERSDSQAQNVDRRKVISALLAGALLLPSRPTLAEEPEVALETNPEAAAVELELTAAETPIASDVEVAEVPSPSPPEEPAVAVQPSTSAPAASVASAPTKVFMDVTINGEPAGRITIELFEDVAAGGSRFAQLAAGREGVDYRLSKFNGVLPTYIRNDGLSRLSYSATEISPIAFGDSLEALEAELYMQTRRHDQPGLVSLIVREKEARPVKERLVARDGKLITVLEQAGEAPNGTQFTITTAPSPELDGTNLIIGRVVEGDVLLKRIAALPVNRPRNDNPYFQAGKAIGDKRAVTAERAFYRPFQKVVVSGSGIAS